MLTTPTRVLRCVITAITLCACGDDGGSGSASGSETETDSDGTTSTTSSTTSTPTSTSSTAGDTTTTTDDTTSTTDATTGTTTGADVCGDCLLENCADPLNACLVDDICSCWIGCIDAGNSEFDCVQTCGAPNMALFDLSQCSDANCMDECSDGGETGGVGGQAYDQCDFQTPCGDGLFCPPVLNYCTPTCEQDGDCPAPDTGDASPVCSQLMVCVLPCGGMVACPDGMMCQDFMGQQLCSY